VSTLLENQNMYSTASTSENTITILTSRVLILEGISTRNSLFTKSATWHTKQQYSSQWHKLAIRSTIIIVSV